MLVDLPAPWNNWGLTSAIGATKMCGSAFHLPLLQQNGVSKELRTQSPIVWSNAWWLIPLSKWVITPVISGLTLLIPCKSLGL